MKLYEQTVIDIDKPANMYLSSWKLRGLNGEESDASVRHLLEHTAGILVGLKDIFFGTREQMDIFSRRGRLATGYKADGSPIIGKYPISPDLAASGLWCSPGELMAIARDFAASINGHGSILCQESVREMMKSPEKIPWVGLGLFKQGEDIIVSKGWGENGQCMLKINYKDNCISVVMTNKDPDMLQEESGVEQLVDIFISTGRLTRR